MIEKNVGNAALSVAKKLLSILLSLCMLLSITAGLDLSVYAETSGDYEYAVLDNVTAEITGYTGNDTELTIPSVLDGYTVKSIGEYAFFENEKIISINIPDTVTEIGYGAFEFCSSLKNIKISENISQIKDEAFYATEYYNDKSNWDDYVLYIGNYLVYADMYSATGDFVVRDNTKLIADGVFSYCSGLNSITIPESVKYIGKSAFHHCLSLREFIVSPSNEYFSACDGVLFNKNKTELIQFNIGSQITSYEIPNSVKKINYGAFEFACIENIIIPNGVEAIEKYAFSMCNSLVSVSIPDTVKNISDYAFTNCFSLKNIDLGNGVIYIGEEAFNNCSNLLEIIIPDSVESLGEAAFYSCEKLKSVKIGENVKDLACSTFSFCNSLTSVRIGNSITSIGLCAFDECESLADVYYSGSKAQWSKIRIDEYNEALTKSVIHYNSSTSHKASYKNAVTPATLTKNGKIVPTCSCGATKTATVVYYPKTIALSATVYNYDGKVKTPAVTVKDAKGKALKKGTDYTVSYASGRKLVGKYAVKITLKGNYSGTKTLYFTIRPKNTSISGITAGSKKFTVKLKKYTTQTTGYQIQYATNAKFTSAKTVAMKNTTTSKTISKLTGGKKYYVRVRTYKTVKINGKNTNIYSAWSSAKAVTTKK